MAKKRKEKICNKNLDSEIQRARELGISYGKYQALKYLQEKQNNMENGKKDQLSKVNR